VEVTGELGTLGRYDFAGLLPRPMIAHPKTCPITGELLFIAYGHDRPHLTYYRADAGGRIDHRAPIDVPAVTYMHDIAITAGRLIFWDLPVLVGDWRSPMPLRWSDDHAPRVGVLPRDGHEGDVQWFPVKPGAISHAMNAFEDGDLVVLDVVRAERLFTPFALYRYTFDLRTGAMTERVLDGRFVDFPRIHPAVEGRPYRHGYALELMDWETGSWQRTLARKYDLETGASVVHDFGPHRMAGELVVAPRAGATREDDAWLMGFVYDRQRQASDFVILDAARFGDEPVAAIRLPRRVPVGLHGAWLAD
jgi:carotenoid cleavage dioxygenase-like enzyme